MTGMAWRGATLAALLAAAPVAAQQVVSTGTGFLIDGAGHIVTNAHVTTVEHEGKSFACRGFVLRGAIDGEAVMVRRDHHNDLALLRATAMPQTAVAAPASAAGAVAIGGGGPVAITGGGQTVAPASLQSAPAAAGAGPVPLPLAEADVPAGSDVYVAGYPLGDLVSPDLKLTRGIVVAASGVGGAASQMQYDAATNPGNSGGPVLGGAGRVIAVHVARIKQAQGHNFGIKSGTLRQFLSAAGVAPAPAAPAAALAGPQLYALAGRAVVLVGCVM